MDPQRANVRFDLPLLYVFSFSYFNVRGSGNVQRHVRGSYILLLLAIMGLPVSFSLWSF